MVNNKNNNNLSNSFLVLGRWPQSQVESYAVNDHQKNVSMPAEAWRPVEGS